MQLSTDIRTIRIVNVATDATEADLRGLLLGWGPILSLSRPLDAESGRAGPVVLVTMADPGASRARAALNGRILKGQTLRANLLVLAGSSGALTRNHASPAM